MANLSWAVVAERVLGARRRAAVATVIASSGSVPQRVGARIALFDDESSVGTVGGGAIELEVLRVLREGLLSGLPPRLRRHLTRDLAMCCGGSMEFFLEVFVPEPRVVLFGAGHVALASAAAARLAGFQVVVVDEREELAQRDRFPDAELVLVPGDEALRREVVHLGPHDYVLVCTHDHALDERVLAECLQTEARFIGMVASKRKSAVIRSRLASRHPKLDLSRVMAPVGLDIGGKEPGEIAISIVAAMIQKRRSDSGGVSGKVLGVVLAAGASTRMTFPKALGRIADETVLERITKTLRAGGCDEVCVVTGGPHEAELRATHPELRFVSSSAPAAGMLGSLHTGWRVAEKLRADWLLVALLDQPFVAPNTIQDLLKCARKTEAPYAVPTYGGRGGHPFVIRAEALELESPSDTETVRDCLRKLERFEVPVNDSAVLDNLDTPEDAARLGVEWPPEHGKATS